MVVTEAPAVVTEAPVVTETPTVAAPTEATAKKVVKFIWTQEFDSLSPIYTNMWFVSVVYPAYLCTPWLFDDQNNAYPYLLTEMPTADNGGITNDGRTFTFKLRDDIKWSDGEPITSADFKFTYDMIMSDKNAVNTRSPYDQIDTVETPDPLTVVINFTDPFAPWQATLFSGSTSGTPIIPMHILQPVFDKDGPSTQQPGTKLQLWVADLSSFLNGNREVLLDLLPMIITGLVDQNLMSYSSNSFQMMHQ